MVLGTHTRLLEWGNGVGSSRGMEKRKVDGRGGQDRGCLSSSHQPYTHDSGPLTVLAQSSRLNLFNGTVPLSSLYIAPTCTHTKKRASTVLAMKQHRCWEVKSRPLHPSPTHVWVVECSLIISLAYPKTGLRASKSYGARAEQRENFCYHRQATSEQKLT